MNKDNMIIEVKTLDDLKKINSNTKYINLDLGHPNKDIIDYFIENGLSYSYSDLIDKRKGYIYVDYETLVNSELLIDNIILSMPNDLNDLEKSKYLYVKLGKLLGYDINILPDKNETFNFNMINTINNVWGAISNNKATNISFCKTYLYLCSKVDIDCEIIMVNQNGYLCNRIKIEDNYITVDLTKDIPFIQSGFKTRYFGAYNNDIELDKKINYINNYSEEIIEKSLKKIDYSKENFLYELLIKTQDIINAKDIKPIELGIIYDIIFHKYCPNYDIKINNLYLNDIYNSKEHFILISYSDKHYSFNYKKNSFILVSDKDLVNNIETNKIGIYLNEDLPFLELKERQIY